MAEDKKDKPRKKRKTWGFGAKDVEPEVGESEPEVEEEPEIEVEEESRTFQAVEEPEIVQAVVTPTPGNRMVPEAPETVSEGPSECKSRMLSCVGQTQVKFGMVKKEKRASVRRYLGKAAKH